MSYIIVDPSPISRWLLEMKVKFTSFDVSCIVKELQTKAEGLRVINVYDINNKSYMIKLGQEVKTFLFIESGSRINLTAFEWPKQLMPSAFSAKCRKVMKNKRLTSVAQVGCDRIVDLQFGSGEFSSHLLIELYDRGNMCLCDEQYVITAVLRSREDAKEDVRYAVGHYYPLELCQRSKEPCLDVIRTNCDDLKPNTQLKRWLNYQFPYSIPLIAHCLVERGLQPEMKLTQEFVLENMDAILGAVQQAHELFATLPDKMDSGYVIFKKVKSTTTNSVMDEFHPILFNQMKDAETKEFPSYNDAIDCFFYEQETQKIEIKSIQQERNVLKKLENIRTDHHTRIKSLQQVQECSTQKAYLIEVNLPIVEEAINIIQNLVANRLSWDEIEELVDEGKENNHAAALAIKKVNFEHNKMTMLLTDPYDLEIPHQEIDIDLALGAYSNAKRYFDVVKQSASKEMKTIKSSEIALKNAEKKTEATIKDINIVASIKKARKPLWFEKFIWFKSSEGYIVIGGRDAQQNEILVKRYLRKHDAYVHADIHGSTSIIVKNKSSEPLPPKTLLEAGCFALCHSAAWTNKIVTSAYWVHANQVSKTAPTGEYLSTGSFMIRGKKNFLPPAQHILGFSVLFKIDEESVEERRKAVSESPAPQTDSENPGPQAVIDVETAEKGDEELKIDSSSSEDEGSKAENELDNLFDKYNLQISAKHKPENSEPGEFTGFVGTAHTPHFNKKDNYEARNRNQGKSQQGENSDSKGNTRRQKTKKKRAAKYAEQSDDEREAAMAFLASAGTKKGKSKTKTANSKLKYKAQSNAKNVVGGFKVEDAKVKLTEAERVEKVLSKQEIIPETLDQEQNQQQDAKDQTVEDGPKAVLDPQSGTQQKVVAAAPQDIDLSDTEDEPIDILESLILNPTPSDTILFGIPFVAPYSAMAACKFRVKLTPGSTKKGKASKTILELFSKDKNASVQEKNVFKSLKDVDMTVNIPGKVKISAPNLHGHRR